MKKIIITTAQRLLASYRSDKSPFQLEKKTYPKQIGRHEVSFLYPLFFPKYFNSRCTKSELFSRLRKLGNLLYRGVRSNTARQETIKIVNQVLLNLPDIREKLKKDIEAAYNGDPAAKDYSEIIRSYPGFRAIMVHRVAHLLYRLGVPSYSRELQEAVHGETGIDIHPGAEIGEYFFIDHGTGVVIGETCEIGNNVRIYQQATLGVLHFAKGAGGVLQKAYKRHPTIGNDVVIGAGAKILGPINIGDGASIGANSWIQEDVRANTTVFIEKHPTLAKKKVYS